MNTDKMIKEVLETEDLNLLYKIKIECSQDLAVLHKRKIMAETNMDQSEAMSNIKITMTLLEVCENRILDLKNDDNDMGRLNHNFRLAAKYMLHKKTYDSIMSEGSKQAYKIRENSETLKSNKLQ